MAETRPTGEQVRFESAKTGSHILDDYLEASERGGRTLPDLLADLFDPTGNFDGSNFQFRANPATSQLQFRVGQFADQTSGWLDTGQYLFRNRGTWTTGQAYKRLDTVFFNNTTYLCVADHTSTGVAPDGNFAPALSAVGLAALNATNTFTQRQVLGGDLNYVGSSVDHLTKLFVRGNFAGVRIGTDASGGRIEGIDTALDTYQPLILGGSSVKVAKSGGTAYDVVTTQGGQTVGGALTVSGTLTLTVAPVFTAQAATRTALGLGTVATQNTGTSGANVPLLNGANTWSAAQTFSSAATFSVAPVFTDQAGSRTALGLGSAATQASTAFAASSTTITGGGLVTGGGALSANQTLTVTAALAADVRAGTVTTKAVTPSALASSAAVITLTYAATVAWDVSQGYNATVTLAGNGQIGAPTNLQDGVTYSLELVQDATGTRVPTWHAIWDWGAAGAPTLQTAAGKADKVFAQYNARTGKLDATFRKGA